MKKLFIKVLRKPYSFFRKKTEKYVYLYDIRFLKPSFIDENEKSLIPKTKFQIWKDQLRFIKKHHEGNWCYFLYKFQYKSPEEMDSYIDYPDFKIERNRLNTQNQSFVEGTEEFNYLVLLRDKFYFGQFLKSLNIPTPENIYFIDGKNYNVTDLSDGTSKKLEELLKIDIECFCKISIGECGKGVFLLKFNNGKIFIDGKESNLNHFKELIKGNKFLLQTRVKQHSVLNSLYSESINTIRMVTGLDSKGESHHLASILRLGARGNKVDNWAAGGIAIGITDDGSLMDEGVFEFPYNNRLYVTAHPDTGVKFQGIKLPYWNEALDMALKLHKYIYGVGTIGWDIAITPKGPIFIEGNDNHEISILQVVHGGLKKKWNEIYS